MGKKGGYGRNILLVSSIRYRLKRGTPANIVNRREVKLFELAGPGFKRRLLPLSCGSVVPVFIAGNSLFVFMVSCFAASRVLTILGDGWIIGLGQCVVRRFGGKW